MRQETTILSTILLSSVLMGAIFTTTLVPRQAYAQDFCGPMDVTIALDNTGSMFGAIDNVTAALPSIIDQAQAASGLDGLPDTADDDLRLGYVTFNDTVLVHHELTFALALVEASINATVAFGGAGPPEA